MIWYIADCCVFVLSAVFALGSGHDIEEMRINYLRPVVYNAAVAFWRFYNDTITQNTAVNKLYQQSLAEDAYEITPS